MAHIFFAITYAGLLMLPHVAGPRWLRLLGRGLAIALALALSAATIALFQLGAERNWTGDGPAMLVIMLLIPIGVVCSLVTWFFALWKGPRWRGYRGVPPWVAIGMVVVGLAGSTKGAQNYQRDLLPAHNAPVVALQFVEAGTRLVSCDAVGTVTRWKVQERSLLDVRSFGALAGAERVVIASDGRFAVGRVGDRTRIVALDTAGSPPVQLRGVADFALLENGDIAVAEGSEVRISSLAAPDVVRATHAFPSRVSALAASASGELFVGLFDGSIVVLGDRGEPDREVVRLESAAHRLVASPGGRWLVALDEEARPSFITTRGGVLRRMDSWARMHRLAFVSEDRLVFVTSEIDPSALALSVDQLRTEPFFNHGQSITAFGTAPGTPEAAIALGGDLLLVPAPVPGLHAYAGSSVRLVPRDYF